MKNDELALAEQAISLRLNDCQQEFKKEVNRSLADLARRGLLSSGPAISNIEELCSNEIKKRTDNVTKELIRVISVSNLQPTSELEANMKEIVKKYISPNLPDLVEAYRRVANNVQGFSDKTPNFNRTFEESIIKAETEISIFILQARNKIVPPSWEKRELLLLKSIAEFETIGKRPNFNELVSSTSMDKAVAEMGFQALLDGDYITGIDAISFDGFDYLEIRLLPKGRQVIGQWPKNELDVQINESGENMNPLIFISHSSKDTDVAEAIIDLIRGSLNLTEEQIRCTSVNGYRLGIGANTNDQLKKEIFGSKVFVGLISYCSLKSPFVMFELGARWGTNKFLAPLLCPGVKTSVLVEPLKSLNALCCNDIAQLQQFVEDVGKELDIKPGRPAAYQKYIDQIVKLSPRLENNENDDNENSIGVFVG